MAHSTACPWLDCISPLDHTEKARHDLHNGWEHSIRTTWLINWNCMRAHHATGDTSQRDAYHGFLLPVFGTLLFPSASTLIDEALAHVILQAVGSSSYVESLVAETVRSFDYVKASRRGRMKGSLHLLQIWLIGHIRPFYSSHPSLYITDDCSLIRRLLHMFGPFKRNVYDWKEFMEELTPGQFLWSAHWGPGSPMTTGCQAIIGLPIISHLGSTLIFPSRFTWADPTTSVAQRFLRVREVRRLWDTRLTQDLYFSKYPTNEERALSVTSTREAGSTRIAQEGNQKNRRTTNPKNSRGRHYGTIHHRIARASEDAFPDGALEGADPRTSKRHPETGLHTPKDHQDHGTSFKLPFRTRLGLPSESRPGKGDPSQTGSSAQSSFGGKLTFEFRAPHLLQLLELGKSFRLGPRSPSGASEFPYVPFLPTTLASHAITFKGSLTTLTLPREEVVTVREPYNRAQLPFRLLSLIGSLRSPISLGAVVGLDVPNSFSPAATDATLRVPFAFDV
ncbi:hypothetical protein CRG98_045212 [Punica granatum]|uniref:DUF7745 domain-containing protein n=1 Tax=Punica granatum TaxID=22663 RepID=A0A2I0HRN8_PUNGR|nr:hypothetical protein CRG98_045212 [Punica granatum]